MIKKIIQYKMTIILSFILIIIVFINIILLSQKGYSQETFPDSLDIELIKSEQIFNEDIFYDYKLSDKNVDACAKFDCYLFVEIKKNDSYFRPSTSKLINHNSQEGTIIIFGSVLQDNNLKSPLEYRFVLEMFSKDGLQNRTLTN